MSDFLRRVTTTLVFIGLSSVAYAQDELRSTFFKEADAARAAAEAANAELLAPRSWSRGVREYEQAEQALRRGRSIDNVRSNAADAAEYFNTAAAAANLATTALSQVLKSRQDAANALAPKLAPHSLWQLS